MDYKDTKMKPDYAALARNITFEWTASAYDINIEKLIAKALETVAKEAEEANEEREADAMNRGYEAGRNMALPSKEDLLLTLRLQSWDEEIITGAALAHDWIKANMKPAWNESAESIEILRATCKEQQDIIVQLEKERDDLMPAKSHEWVNETDTQILESQFCKICRVMRRKDGQNSPCSGVQVK